MRQFLVFVLACILLSSCNAITPASTPTILQPTNAIYTSTPSPVSVPSLTPTVSFYQIPEWLKSSNHVLLLTVKSKFVAVPNPYNQVVFFNADTGAQFSIKVEYFEYAFWLDNTHVGFLDGSSCSVFNYGTILDLTTGKVSKYKASELADKKFCPYPKYLVRAYFWNDGTPVNIYNTRTGSQEDLIDKSNTVNNLNANLSPDESTIMVLQDRNGDYLGDKFQIYDFQSRKLRGSSEVSNIGWNFFFTKDSKQIVYLKGTTPCFLNLVSLEKKCGIPIKMPSPHLEGLSTDGSKVIFQYDYYPGSDYYNGRLCIYGIFTGDLNCPTENLDVLAVKTFNVDTGYGIEVRNSGRFIATYRFSPDEKIISFVYSYGYPGCDNFSDIGIAVVSVDKKVYYNLGENFESIFSHIPEWKPSP